MTTAPGYFVEQNLGFLDRTVRFVIGAAMLAVPYFMLTQQGAVVEPWQAWLMVLSVYPCLTGILGIDPIYRVFGKKSCDLSNRNRCGSYPFQVDALIGRDPQPEDDYEHTLEHSRHRKAA